MRPTCSNCGETMMWEDADTLYCPSCCEYEFRPEPGDEEEHGSAVTRREERPAENGIKRPRCDGLRHGPMCAYRTPEGQPFMVFDCQWDDLAVDGWAQFRHYAKVVHNKVRLLVVDVRFLEKCARADLDLILWTDTSLRAFYDSLAENLPSDYKQGWEELEECENCGGALSWRHSTHWNDEIENVVPSYSPNQQWCAKCGRVVGEAGEE